MISFPFSTRSTYSNSSSSSTLNNIRGRTPAR